ncbi:hypothetical protein ANCCAN_10928 [Ancylostoma caninum]|uniref:Acyltransferase 3 domain-containing protein n=1 Tax=Ancylostoma caninum TaxID=29170 RepID=A0A368GJD7_ANCCA|nr:hypothetical protein ANCCAN_10928 [Ancylostoma caninum]
MSMPFWTPLGRLTYCAYLSHIFIMTFFLHMERRPIHYINLAEVYAHDIIPITFLTLTFAFVWSVLFEVPTARLESALLRRRRPKPAAAQDPPSNIKF